MGVSALRPIRSRNLKAVRYIPIRTDDGWTISLTHIEPLVINPDIPYALLMDHGFAQNRRSFKAGMTTTKLIDNGVNVYIIEHRGHGKSREYARERGRKGAHDYCFDHYVAYDIPAALEHIKEETGQEQAFFAGHSLGAMVGYAALPDRPDIRGLISLGGPVQLDKTHGLLKVLSRLDWLVDPPLIGEIYRTKVNKVTLKPALNAVKALLPYLKRIDSMVDLWDRENVNQGEIHIVLGDGSENEPTKNVAQLLRWINRQEFCGYRDLNGFGWDPDYKERLTEAEQPILFIRGEQDKLTTYENSTKYLRETKGKLEDHVVRSTNHMGLTMGLSVEKVFPLMMDYMERYSR